MAEGRSTTTERRQIYLIYEEPEVSFLTTAEGLAPPTGVVL
jgi:hypothetical protein